jgi:hypothetical protein
MKCFLCYRQRGFKKIFLLHEGVKIALAGEFSLNSVTYAMFLKTPDTYAMFLKTPITYPMFLKTPVTYPMFLKTPVTYPRLLVFLKFLHILQIWVKSCKMFVFYFS